MSPEQLNDPTESLSTASNPRVVARKHLMSLRGDHPKQIGPYKILEILGEGAMGMVYLAEQSSPIHRQVALKIIRAGMDSQELIARFETEREALALMSHPNVAKVFDAGTSETGRPYFAMEYVPGSPMTEYCDRQRLGTEQRLRLFMEVCQAVQHAHQKGIIHRDIKPSNVLVSEVDGQPSAKVIDFGIAKATQQKLSHHTMFTQQGQMIGTPAYMSPEQAGGNPADIDTRSDLYSLGVLLYELLTGARPFEDDMLRRAAIGEMQRIIREVDPPKPSTRLGVLKSSSGAALPDPLDIITANRRTHLSTLLRQLRGGLDWIVMKCLEKDRNRRYETVNGLVMEIQRFLNNEPVLAGPPSSLYRMRKFIRRHRMPFGIGSAAGLAVFVGVALALSSYLRAVRAENHITWLRHKDVVQLLIGQMGPYKHAIHFFKKKTGRLPDTLNELIAKPSNADQEKPWTGPLMKAAPDFAKDQWGHTLQYQMPGTHHPDAYDLWSVGQDGINGTDDDIGNWECPVCLRKISQNELF